MPLQATSGAASYDAFGGGVPVVPAYIEDVFSTYLYIGNGTTNVITNNIDLSGKGGMVWMKSRSNAFFHGVYDTVRGTGTSKSLYTNTTEAQGTNSTNQNLTAFNADGFTLGATSSTNAINGSNGAMCSWTFRKQPKFFDVVTYTGNGTAGRTIAHNLGSVPGCIIVKQIGGGSTGGVNNWFVYHRSLGGTKYVALDSTIAAVTSSSTWNNTDPTSTVFTIGGTSDCNDSGGTYVAYLFSHDAGGFGLTGTDNVISCGSFTTGTGFGAFNVNLGYEPQLVLIKRTDAERDWEIIDTMRRFDARTAAGDDACLSLLPNSSAEESNGVSAGPNSTGFSSIYTGTASATYIYIAIRRGPMKVPTDATTVFEPNTTSNGTLQSGTVPVKDAVLNFNLASTAGWQIADRLRGILKGFPTNTVGAVTTNPYLITNSTAAESTSNCRIGGLGIARSIATAGTWYNGDTAVIANGNFDTAYFLQRAPSFFDVVILNNSTTTYTHNLTVSPELIFVKCRNAAGANWVVYSKSLSSPTTQFLVLNNTSSTNTYGAGAWSVSSTQFSVDTGLWANGSRGIAYLFGTCAGVSKVFSFTGNGSSQTINCGFTGGARFVLIKRTDDVGDWYVWDSARGIVSGNDPHLSLNTTSAQVTTNDSIDTDSTGFVVNQDSATNVNVSSATYIGLAIA